jgi:hypothetical protein
MRHLAQCTGAWSHRAHGDAKVDWVARGRMGPMGASGPLGGSVSMQQAVRDAAAAGPLVSNEPQIEAEPHNYSWARPLHAPANQKSVRSGWANGKLSLMPTMAFLEFQLSGLASASKPRAPESRAGLSAAEWGRQTHWACHPICARRVPRVPSAPSGSHGSRIVARRRGLCGTGAYKVTERSLGVAALGLIFAFTRNSAPGRSQLGKPSARPSRRTHN